MMQGGSEKLQDMMPMAPGGAVSLDPQISLVRPPPERKDIESVLNAARQPAQNHRHQQRRMRDTTYDRSDTESVRSSTSMTRGCRSSMNTPPPRERRGRRSPPPLPPRRSRHPDRHVRKYRPDEHDSMDEDDFDLLANPTKLKDEKSLPADPIDSLKRDMAAPMRRDRRRYAHDEDGDGEDDEDDDDEFNDHQHDGGEYGGSDVSGDEYGSGGEDDENGDDEIGNGDRGGNDAPRLTYRQRLERKCAIVAYLDHHVKTTGEKLDYNSGMTLEQLDVIKGTVKTTKHTKHALGLMQHGLLLYGRALVKLSELVPWLNMDLKGFYEELYRTRTDYDDLLIDVLDMYGEYAKLNPVIMLGLTITGNAIVYSAGRNFVKHAHMGLGIQMAPARQSQQTTQHQTPSRGPDAMAGRQVGSVPPQPMGHPGPGTGSDTGLRQAARDGGDNGIADVELDGPTGFDNNELLNICRAEVEAKMQDEHKGKDAVINVDIPRPSTAMSLGSASAEQTASSSGAASRPARRPRTASKASAAKQSFEVSDTFVVPPIGR